MKFSHGAQFGFITNTNALGACPKIEKHSLRPEIYPPLRRAAPTPVTTPLPTSQSGKSNRAPPLLVAQHVISRIEEKPTSRYCRHKDVSPHVPHSFGLGLNISLLFFFFLTRCISAFFRLIYIPCMNPADELLGELPTIVTGSGDYAWHC